MIELTPSEAQVLKAIEDAGGEILDGELGSKFHCVSLATDLMLLEAWGAVLMARRKGKMFWGYTDAGRAALRAYEAKTL